MTTAAPTLDLRGISRMFGRTQALADVNLTVHGGCVHALLGENGAGKTTLMRIAYGIERPDAGTVSLFGAPAGEHGVSRAIRAGVGMVHQHLSLAPTLNGVENIALTGAFRFDPGTEAARARGVSDRAGLAIPLDVPVGELSIVEQQRLEILKALVRDARLLILDEPTAVLAPSESDELLRWIRRFADGGGAVVLVTHKLREALGVADRLTVLRRGRVVLSANTSDVDADTVARAMFPDRSAATPPAPSAARPGPVIVRADHLDIPALRGRPAIRDVSLEIRGGETVAIAGVDGSGARTLVQVLAGLIGASSARLMLPRAIGYIPADRVRDGLIPDFSLVENIALGYAGSRRGIMRWRQVATRTQMLLHEYDVTPAVPRARARTLSGGNQQRVVIARELDGNPELVVADNPTRGLDLRSSEYVQRRLIQGALAGAAVVVHSSDIDELLGIATRVLTVFDGHVTETPPDREAIARAMVGAV